MKPLLLIFIFASTATAQSATDRTFVIPDFKVTAESLAKAHRNYPILVDVAQGEYERARLDVIAHRPAPNLAYCLTMHSFNFNKSATPKLVRESNCTMVNTNGFLRVQR